MKKESAASITQLWGGMSQHGDTDCFYSTAAFKDEWNPDADHVRAKRAFYLDLDVGKKTGYETQAAAIRAVVSFCQAVEIPLPGFVLSGAGVHAYWTLNADISRAAWQPYASGLKAACKEKGLKADGAVTADPARILRCPGTFNCKQSPKTEVMVHPVFFTMGPYSLGEFAPLLTYLSEVEGLPEPPAAHFEGSAVLNDQTAALYGSALDAIPNSDDVPYDTWFRVGAAIYELGWIYNDVGRNMWLDWSRRASKHTDEEFDKAWYGFPKYRETHLDKLITPGTLMHMAQEAGWTPSPPAPVLSGTGPPPIAAPFVPSPELLALAATGDTYELARAAMLHVGPEKNDKGCWAQRSYRNACWALFSLGVRGRYDQFTGKYEVKLHDKWERKTDTVTIRARDFVMEQCGNTDPGTGATNDALTKLCEVVGPYHSVRDYLGGLSVWDGTPRIDTWLTHYLGAGDTPLNRFYGATTLVAAVRRARREDYVPFDHMLVLEGNQGVGKSTVVQILGGPWFKNQAINWQDARSQVEVFRGCWFYEWAELQGHGRAEEGRIKTALSSPLDEARLAYRRDTDVTVRRTILIGTTNETEDYLMDHTGARRYWCVKCGDEKFKLEELRHDRDQLFAEAVAREAAHGAYLDPPMELWAAEREVHEGRTSAPQLADTLSQLAGTVDEGREWITMSEIKLSPWMANIRIYTGLDRQIAQAMRSCGWTRDMHANHLDGRGLRTRRFWRPVA
jgi:putative DNA primase/helicase